MNKQDYGAVGAIEVAVKYKQRVEELETELTAQKKKMTKFVGEAKALLTDEEHSPMETCIEIAGLLEKLR